jgi:PAS domain S-box-containing protein
LKKKVYINIVEYFFASLVIFTVLYLAKRYNYLLFHSFSEIFSIVVAGSIFMLAWTSRDISENYYFLFIGTAYLFVALLDTVHTLAYTGMGIIKGYGTNLPTHLWISSRYMESLSLLIAPLFISRRKKPYAILASYGIIFILIFASIFYWKNFPVSFIEGHGLTPFKIISEYIICLILIGAIYYLFKIREKFNPGVFWLLVASMAVTIFSELSFTLYTDPYGMYNLFGHYLKIISFYLIYKAIIVTGIRQPSETFFLKLKQSERSLRKERETMVSILDSMDDCVYIVDVNGDIQYVNPAMRRNFGQVEGRKCYEFLYNRKDRCPWCMNKEVYSGKSVQWEFEDKLRGKTYDLLETPIENHDNKITAKLKIFRDITQRKKAEEVLARDKKTLEKLAEEKSRELIAAQKKLAHAQRLSDIGTFASMIAHELKNPLSTMKLAIYNVKRKTDDSRITGHIERINNKIEESLQIINNLLFHARIRESHFKEVNISGILEECAEEFVVSKGKITVIENLKDIRGVIIDADLIQIKEVINNLFNNASDAVDEDSGRIEVIASRNNGRVIITIKDNGKGIDNENMEKIFEPFFTTKTKGTGLGLAVCRQIARNHNGELTINSRKGEGTTVVLTLPVKQNP